MRSTIKSPPVYKIALIQLIVILGISGICIFHSEVLSYSALLGGLICIVPSAFFARFAFKYRGAKMSTLVARSFYLGEAGKFLFTAVLFAVTFVLVEPVHFGGLFISYVIAVIVGLIAGLRIVGTNS